jgi:hypothetical protein
MKKLILIMFIWMISCAPKQVIKTEPLKYSFIPKYLDFDSVSVKLPRNPEEVVDTFMLEHFEPISLGAGDTAIEDGILISERMAAYYPFYKEGYERQVWELEIVSYLMREYYDKAKAAEVLYQDQIIKLKKENEKSWVEKNIGYIGFIAGIVTAILTEIAVLRFSD